MYRELLTGPRLSKSKIPSFLKNFIFSEKSEKITLALFSWYFYDFIWHVLSFFFILLFCCFKSEIRIAEMG